MHTCWCTSTPSLQDASPACPPCCVQMALVEAPNPADGEQVDSELQGRAWLRVLGSMFRMHLKATHGAAVLRSLQSCLEARLALLQIRAATALLSNPGMCRAVLCCVQAHW